MLEDIEKDIILLQDIKKNFNNIEILRNIYKKVYSFFIA